MDETIKKINKLITLQKKDREFYTMHYNNVLNYLTTGMKDVDKWFNDIFKGNVLTGSYADGIKVSKPNEFDVLLRLKFCKDEYLEVTKVQSKSAYITININTYLQQKTNDPYVLEKIKFLKTICDENGNLVQNLVLKWLYSLIRKVTMNLKNRNNWHEFSHRGHRYFIRTRTSGPAQTIDVEISSYISFSIDLVGSIVLSDTHWVAETPMPPIWNEVKWNAVPKPDKDLNFLKNSSNIKWISSYSDLERIYLANKNSLKITIRLFKKLRDTHNFQSLKSYLIKSVFLLHVRKVDKSYWDQSVGLIFMEMFEILLNHLKSKSLPFYWDPTYNLMTYNFSENQICSLYNQLKRKYDDLVKNINDPAFIVKIFLTPDEQTLYYSGQVEKQSRVVECMHSNTQQEINSSLDYVNHTNSTIQWSTESNKEESSCNIL